VYGWGGGGGGEVRGRGRGEGGGGRALDMYVEMGARGRKCCLTPNRLKRKKSTENFFYSVCKQIIFETIFSIKNEYGGEM
jgi:hypothetical protein